MKEHSRTFRCKRKNLMADRKLSTGGQNKAKENRAATGWKWTEKIRDWAPCRRPNIPETDVACAEGRGLGTPSGGSIVRPPTPGRTGALPDCLYPLQAGSGQGHSPSCRSLLTRQFLRSKGAASSPCAVRRRSQPVHERRFPHAPGGPGGQSGRQSCLRLRLWENSSWQRFWSDLESKPLCSVGGNVKWRSPVGNRGGAKHRVTGSPTPGVYSSGPGSGVSDTHSPGSQ